MWGIREVNKQMWLAEWYHPDSPVPGELLSNLWVENVSGALHTTVEDAKRIADQLYREHRLLTLATRIP
jgi:hypothetical protein